MNAMVVNKQTIKNFIQTELVRNRAHPSMKEDENLIENGTIDSLGIMKLLSYLEESFSIRVSDDELLPENFESIDAITGFLANKLRG